MWLRDLMSEKSDLMTLSNSEKCVDENQSN